MLNNRKEQTSKRKSVTGIRTQEEVDKTLEKMKDTRHLINTEPEKAKCEICKHVNMKISKDKNKWCRDCRRENQQHENTCKECGIWEMDMADNRCERCWTTTLAEKVIAEREEKCWEKKCTKKGTCKFFGHSVCKEHARNIPGPLEAYAASWISAGEDINTINEGLDKIFNKGEECEIVKGNTTTPIEWFYKWEFGKEEPELRRGSNLLLIKETEAIMGKDRWIT